MENMAAKTYKITKIEQVVEVATVLSSYWFRGQSDCYGDLTPGIFRKNVLNDEDREYRFIEKFKRYAPYITANLPALDNYLEWLFLMQHHGAPTRLLDWTESALIALYFAVACDETEKPGELWAMNPYWLNYASGINGICTLDHPKIKYLAAEPMYYPNEDNLFKLEIHLNLFQTVRYPLAFNAPMNFPRMIYQLSAFTIHPDPNKGSTIIQLLENKPNVLVRYIIPGKCKRELKRDLGSLGITRRTLFQDLDSLCSDLKEDQKRAPYNANTLPNPPICDGEYEI